MTKKTNLGQGNDAKLIDPENVPSTYIADLLAVTPKTVSLLASQKTIKNNGRRGRYRLADTVPVYISSLRGTGKADADARLKVQQTRKLQLLNDETDGKLVRIEDAAEAYRQGCLAWRAGANALPRRLATMLANQDDPGKIQKVLVREFESLFDTMEKPLREYFTNAGVSFKVVETRPARASPAPKKKPRSVGRRKKNPTPRKRGTRKVAKR